VSLSLFDVEQALGTIDRAEMRRAAGHVVELCGLVLRARLPGARAGELVTVEASAGTHVAAEVVGFAGDEVVLMPLGEVRGVGPDSVVEATGRPLTIHCGEALLGRVLDGLGNPLDGGPPLLNTSPVGESALYGDIRK
jgi:type III secretion protein N (ATPase)